MPVLRTEPSQFAGGSDHLTDLVFAIGQLYEIGRLFLRLQN